MNDTIQIAASKNRKRCAVYCRVSSDERLDQVREAAEKLLANTVIEAFDVRVEQ